MYFEFDKPDGTKTLIPSNRVTKVIKKNDGSVTIYYEYYTGADGVTESYVETTDDYEVIKEILFPKKVKE